MNRAFQFLPRFGHALRRSGSMLLFLALAQLGLAAPPVELVFQLPVDGRDPFHRDVWAEVVAPSGRVLKLPVYYRGDNRFAVRARAEEEGNYRLGEVTERSASGTTVIRPTIIDRGEAPPRRLEELRPVVRSATDPTRLAHADGTPYTPVGTNLAWPPNGRKNYYPKVFEQFRNERLNWVRIWMAHWSGLNLDWPAPKHETLALQVASEWDSIIAEADDRGVYVQLVLQHHGQYSSTVNPNWPSNPWNAANPGGFLKTPGEFFTSPKARELTRWKYRYIVARWGYSPAILAWELFNEVHWVDAMRQDKREADVAEWHTEMAKYLRSIDTYQHLVTTSTEDLNSPIYAAMDYFQPHLYTADVIAGTRTFMRSPGELDRPVFYGEFGDDHLALSAEQKKSAISIVPPVWAGLMGRGKLPPQPWLGADLIEQGRLGELGAVERFIETTRFDRRAGLASFSAVVESVERQPLAIAGVQRWQRRPAPELELPLDGRHLPEFGNILQVYSGSPEGRASGFPERTTFHVNAPRDLEAKAVLVGMSERGSSIRLSIDGRAVAKQAWQAKAPDAPTLAHPAEVPFRIPAGKHTLVVENPGGPDWFELGRLEFGVEVSPLAAIGQRNDGFIALWLWHRDNIFSLEKTAAVTGTVSIENVPSGRWRVVWWESIEGAPDEPKFVEHAGGVLKVPTPPIQRHAAVVLTKM